MEGEKNISTNEEVKKIEEQHEKARKMGAVAAAALATFLNTSPVAAAGYTPPTEPSESPDLIVPKTGEEQPVTGDIVLRPGMTPDQIDAMAKEAIKRYGMEQDFKQVIQECTKKAVATEDTQKGIDECVAWYKAEAAKGNSHQALVTIQNSLKEAIAQQKAVHKNMSEDFSHPNDLTVAFLAGLVLMIVGGAFLK
jgi:hypothetical protein